MQIYIYIYNIYIYILKQFMSRSFKNYLPGASLIPLGSLVGHDYKKWN